MYEDMLPKLYDKIDWRIAGLFTHDTLILNLKRICDKVGLPFLVKTVFGGFVSRLHGGRPLFTLGKDVYDVPVEKLIDIITQYNDNNIGCFITLSKPNLNPEYFTEEKANRILEVLNKNSLNGVIVSDDNLKNYIKANYNNLVLTSSHIKVTTETIFNKTDTIEYYDNLCEQYDEVVINTSRAYDLEFMSKFKYPEKIEIIVNEDCVSSVYCPQRKRHYDIFHAVDEAAFWTKPFNQQKLYKSLIELTAIGNYCQNMHDKFSTDLITMSTTSIRQLVNLGIRHFKIKGREDSSLKLLKMFNRLIYKTDKHFFSMYKDDFITIQPSLN